MLRFLLFKITCDLARKLKTSTSKEMVTAVVLSLCRMRNAFVKGLICVEAQVRSNQGMSKR